MKRQRPRSSLDINSPRGCIRICLARIPGPSRPGRYGNLNRLPIIRRKHIDYLLLRIIHHLIDVTAYIGCIDIDVIRDLRNRCFTCKTCQYQTCKDTCQNTVLIFHSSYISSIFLSSLFSKTATHYITNNGAQGPQGVRSRPSREHRPAKPRPSRRRRGAAAAADRRGPPRGPCGRTPRAAARPARRTSASSP